MLATKLKWMAIGVVSTVSVVFVYKKIESYQKMNGGNAGINFINSINPEFAGYINAFTTGYIPTGSSIKIRLSHEFGNNMQLNTPVDEKFFSFEPKVEGSAVWKDAQTIEFIPKERLKQGQQYKATFHLGKLVDVKSDLKEFDFKFNTVKQDAKLEFNDLKCYQSNDYTYYNSGGSIFTADYANPEQIEKSLLVQYPGAKLKVKWLHNDKGTQHSFLIDSITRPTNASSLLTFAFNGKEAGLELNENKKIDITSKNEFRLLNVSVKSDNEQYVLLTFSNPIDQNRSIENFIEIPNQNDVKFIITNNQVFMYPNNLKAGNYTLKVREGIRDTKGKSLAQASEHNIVFNDVKPAVRFTGGGNILPSSNNLNLPFETVNLKAVDVKIFKIYESNVLQFLQTNSLNDNGNLAQVGKKIVDKRINLGITNPADFGIWKKFTLDLSTLIKREPGAIYRITMSIKKAYSTYPCLGNNEDEKFEMEEISEEKEEENPFYGYYYDDYYYGYDYEYGDEGDEYSWSNRDNPCKAAYYRQYDKTISKNILASDIGLIVKSGNNGNLFIAANDIVTTDPMKGVVLELYDYQKQLIQIEKTNGDGQCFITAKQKPAFIVAKKDEQRAYVRLDDGASLPLSMYDVSGDAVKKGIKGFIYGERGVWRPGDSLFINFILEDKEQKLPENHPVSFELRNPQGQLVKRIFKNKSVDGFYSFFTETSLNAPTGLWSAEVKVGSVKFSKSIRIESIMPNRLKLEVNVGDNKLLNADDNNKVTLHANWLTGAKVQFLPASISVALSKTTTQFDKYKDYVFDDATRYFESQNQEVFDGKLDENGDASTLLNLNLEGKTPGFLKAIFFTRVYEQSGAFSVDHFSVTYSPYSYYVGINTPSGERNTGILHTGKDHKIQIASVNFKGNGVSRNKIRFDMYKMEWRWWWEQYEWELANYATDEYHKPVHTEIISTTNGKGSVTVNIPEHKWGRYLLRVTDLESGHSATKICFFDWPNWMNREGGEDNKIISNMLQFNTDKSSYKVGEDALVNIPSPEKGRALVTIENGTKILEAHWLQTEKGNSTFRFKITPEMAPNVYVHVSLMQPHKRANDLPIRMYGVVPVLIDDPETHLRPVINMPNELVPEQNVSITVSEENGKAMAFTLAMVDEGLLDITRFKTPNPWNSFYAKEALGVKSWDLYDHVIGAFGGELERILSVGGDGLDGRDDGAKTNRFKPMVKFIGPIHLSKGEKKKIEFKMPLYIGSVRTMVIAGYKGAYGSSEKTTPVKAPLMVLGTLPRVLSVTEEVKLPVTLFGGSKAIGKTEVKIETNEFVQLVGGNTKTINLGKDEEKMLSFQLKVKNKTGIAKIKITANGGGHSSKYEMELDVRNPNPYQTNIKDLWVDAGKTIEENVMPTGLAGTNSGVVELSTIPPINLNERLNYLITYPHGCIEQTTSQTFAQLYLNDIMELNDDLKNEIESNIKKGINSIGSFQLRDGSLSYWPGTTEPSDWGTTYGGHFMICAEKKGYALPPGFKKNWISYQSKVAQNFELNKNKYFNNDVLQAYRLYVLALANSAAMSAMNRLRENNNLSNQAKWYLAGAYALAGQIDESEKLLAKSSTDVGKYQVNYYTYGSSERDLAVILDVLCTMNKKSQALTQLKKVSAFLSSKSWLSTQTTAYGLVAVSNFIKKYGGASAMQANVSINGKEVSLKGNSAISQIPLNYKDGKNCKVKIVNNGKGGLYVRVITRGKPEIGSETEESQNVSISTVFKDMNGNSLMPDELPQSTNFIMQVTVKNMGLSGEIKNLALMNYIPSGWEIHNNRINSDESENNNHNGTNYTYQDIRDDRVLTYFDLYEHEAKTFTILLNAAYEGSFYLPGTNVEGMYDNSVYARDKGRWIKVIKQDSPSVAEK